MLFRKPLYCSRDLNDLKTKNQRNMHSYIYGLISYEMHKLKGKRDGALKA